MYETEKDLLDILKSYPIDIRILGVEYADKEYTGRRLEGIEVYYNSREHSFSTTELRDRVREAEERKLKY